MAKAIRREPRLRCCLILGAGQTHQTGKYKDTVSKGLRWLLKQQKKDGDLRHNTAQGMYSHGQATIVLCEIFKLTGDEQFRVPAQKAVNFIVKAQSSKDGGWRYRPGETRGDLSVVGWQLMALQSARAAGLTVPDNTFDRASNFLDLASAEGGSQYRYQPEGYQHHRGPTETMTAEGLLCRMYLGWTKHAHPEMGKGVEYLVQSHLPRRNKYNMYYWYYATQVMHHYGGKPWETWNAQMRTVLTQMQRNDGAWSCRGSKWSSRVGDIYSTSLAVCTLEVYYRHAPIFRRIQLD